MNIMRKFILFLCAMIIAIPVYATGEKAFTPFSHVETMVFRNYQAPTPDYNGIKLFGILDGDSADVTKGDTTGTTVPWLADSLITITDGTGRILFKIDISALPDSAVPIEATLYMLKTNTDYTSTLAWKTGLHRLFKTFDGHPTWTNRKTETEVDTAWTVGGALALSKGKWDVFGAGAATLLYCGTNRYTNTFDELPTVGGFPLAMGADSVYSGYSQTGTANQYSEALNADTYVTTYGLLHSGVTKVWARFDILKYVLKWHFKQWANHGIVFSIDDGEGKYAQFRGVYPTHNPASSVVSQLQPFVVIKYLYCVAPD